MATRFYLRSSASTLVLVGWDERELLLTAGSALTTASESTLTGPVANCTILGPVVTPGSDIRWISNPISGVTISGTVTVNLWMAESNMAANVGPQIGIGRLQNDGTFVENVLGCAMEGSAVGTTYEKGTELPVTTRAAQNWTATPASVTFSAGDRIAVHVQMNDGGGTMASGHTASLGFAGATGGADGDSWVEFTETITEESAATASLLRRPHRFHLIRR